MSILNHFGKVKASYKKYESDLPEYKGYICNQNTYNWQNDCVSFENSYSNKTMTMNIKNYNNFNDRRGLFRAIFFSIAFILPLIFTLM